jgi:hypothetical protein
MFYQKAQKEIFNAMLNEKTTVAKIPMGDDKVIITTNGYVGWVFPLNLLKVNIEKMRGLPALDLDGFITTENKLEATKDFVLADEQRKLMVRRYRKGRTSVFINPKLLEHFEEPTLYQKSAPLGIIVVTEKISRSSEGVVGVVLPMRDSGSWAERYADYF